MKRLVCILLVCTMIGTIMGCSKTPKKNEKEQASQESVNKHQNNGEVETTKGTDERPMEGNMYLEGFPIVKEPIKIKVAAIDWWNTGDYGKLQMPKEYEALTNIEVEWLNITSTEQLNLIFASGEELPDLFMFLDYDKINELGQDGQLLPVGDLIKEYAPNIQTMMDKEPDAKKLCTAPDGNMYIIPSMYRSPGESLRGSTYINREWLEALELDLPTTVDEYYDVLKAFKENDPNGNGQPDEIPLCLEWENDINGICSLFGPWGVTSAVFGPFYAKDEKKEIVASVMEPGYKEAIKYFHRLYAEGLLDQEAFTQDHDKYQSKVSENVERETIIVGASNGYTPANPGDRELGDAIYTKLPPLEGPGGKHHIIPIGGGIFANNYMSADTKYAKEVIRWADGIADPERSFTWNAGPEGLFFERDENGKFEKISKAASEGLNNSDYSFVLPIMGIYGEWYTDNVVLDKGTQSKLQVLEDVKPYGDQYVVSSTKSGKLPLHFSQEEEQFLATHYVDIEQYCKNKEAQWIMTGGIDEEWDDYLKQLKKMKITELQEMYQKALDQWNK